MRKYNIEKLYFRFDKNQEIIQKYCDLVVDIYKDDLNLLEYKQNYLDIIYDNNSHPVIVIYEGEVIGGAILYTSDNKGINRLPLEIDTNISIAKYLDNDNEKYSEISKIALLPRFRDRRVTVEITRFIIAKAYSQGCNYIYCTSFETQTRNFRIVINKLGLQDKKLKTYTANYRGNDNLSLILSSAKLKDMDTSKLVEGSYYYNLIKKILFIRNPSENMEDYFISLNHIFKGGR